MAITALPTPPSRSDPTNFATEADAFLGALPLFQTEANDLQIDVNAKQVLAAASQTAANTSEVNAAASELAAANSAGATIWVSGTTYAIGNVRFSPINYLTYRRKTAGAGTTDPSQDSTNWQLLTAGLNKPFVISTSTTAITSAVYVITAALTLTLPLNPVAGDTVFFSNWAPAGALVTIGRNAQNIMQLAEDMIVDLTKREQQLLYVDATRGWIFV